MGPSKRLLGVIQGVIRGSWLGCVGQSLLTFFGCSTGHPGCTSSCVKLGVKVLAAALGCFGGVSGGSGSSKLLGLAGSTSGK